MSWFLAPLNFNTLRWQCSVVVSALPLINVVNQHWARLLLGWVTACGQVNHHVTSHLGQLSLLLCMGWQNEHELSGWVIINGDGGCSFLVAYRRANGSSPWAWCKGRQPSGTVLHSSREPGELTQWLWVMMSAPHTLSWHYHHYYMLQY